MGAKPTKGTPRDMRLKRNRRDVQTGRRPPKVPTPPRPTPKR